MSANRHRTAVFRNTAGKYSFYCKSCKKDEYQKTPSDLYEHAVDDARAHRFAYREIERLIQEEGSSK